MKKQELLSGIQAVMLGIDKSSAIGSDFLLLDGEWIRSLKDDISVSFPLNTGIQTAVRAEELYKILSKMDDEELDISLSKENKLVIKGGRTTIRMNPLQKDQINHSLERAWAVQTNDLEFFYLPKGFWQGLELCLSSAGTGPALAVLAGIHFTGSSVISTDNFRVSVFSMEEEVPHDFTIPTKTAENILKLGIEFESLALNKSWLHLANKEGAIFSARILAGEYPVKKVTGLFSAMKFDLKESPLEFPKGLEGPLDRAKVLAGAEGEGWESLTQVSMSYSDGFLTLQASKDVGEILDQIEWKEKHIEEGIELKVQPDFFKKILAITRSFHMSPTKKSLLFSSDKFKHIMVATLK